MLYQTMWLAKSLGDQHPTLLGAIHRLRAQAKGCYVEASLRAITALCNARTGQGAPAQSQTLASGSFHCPLGHSCPKGRWLDPTQCPQTLEPGLFIALHGPTMDGDLICLPWTAVPSCLVS